MVTLRITNLPPSTSDSDLHDLCSEFGMVMSAACVTDRETGKFMGMGFVEMIYGGYDTLHALNFSDFRGHTIQVEEVRRPE